VKLLTRLDFLLGTYFSVPFFCCRLRLCRQELDAGSPHVLDDEACRSG